jgi:Domain of unknown function (DUF4160)
MALEEEFDELQQLFAQKDLLYEPRRPSSGRFLELLLAKRKNMKIKIYQETGHHLPHIHVDYGKLHHVASYAIQSGERIDGNLPKQYDADVSSWLERNREKVLVVWRELQEGSNPRLVVSELAGVA